MEEIYVSTQKYFFSFAKQFENSQKLDFFSLQFFSNTF